MNLNYSEIQNFVKTGIGGGIAGGIQLSSLYWLRTIIKYQYVYPYSLPEVSRKLWRDTDRIRLFRGFVPNFSKVFLGKVGEASLIKYFEPSKSSENITLCTLKTSAIITGWKTLMMPFDTIGNCYQVNGLLGREILKNRFRDIGFQTFWSGTLVYLNISFINYSIWVYTYHQLNQRMTSNINSDIRNGIIGLCSTFMADIVINPLRVLKTNIQSQKENKNYGELCRNVFLSKKDLYRGFKTKMLFNCFNGALYVILWKRLDDW